MERHCVAGKFGAITSGHSAVTFGGDGGGQAAVTLVGDSRSHDEGTATQRPSPVGSHAAAIGPHASRGQPEPAPTALHATPHTTPGAMLPSVEVTVHVSFAAVMPPVSVKSASAQRGAGVRVADGDGCGEELLLHVGVADKEGVAVPLNVGLEVAEGDTTVALGVEELVTVGEELELTREDSVTETKAVTELDAEIEGIAVCVALAVGVGAAVSLGDADEGVDGVEVLLIVAVAVIVLEALCALV